MSQNRLLAQWAERCPHEYYVGLVPKFRRVTELVEGDDAVYFVEQGYASMLTKIPNDFGFFEVAMIGPEGMIGLPLFYGVQSSSLPVKVTLSQGSALRLPGNTFRAALKEEPALQPPLLRYAAAFTAQLMITSVCNTHHLLEQRLASWLLRADECVGGGAITASQEVLAQAMGVHRPSITVAMMALKSAGCIENGRRQIRIVDREELETVACDCRSASACAYAAAHE